MSKKLPEKIQKAIDRGELIPYDEVWNSFSKERQERIEQKVRYLKAAMELRRVRQDARISQAKLARKMKVKREFISRIESGRQNITLDTLYRVGEAMGKKFHFAFK
ncbi:MAG: helix-turn-helix transcriptional regulator [Patescibacteria group bacterium]